MLGAYDPEPDYFFHWFRDSAVVIDALRVLFHDPRIEGNFLADLADFVHFSLSLQNLDGRRLTGSPWREAVAPDFRQFVRTEEDLSAAHGEAVSAETRVNPDGTLDISRWPRPQNDGPAMRAIALLQWRQSARLDAELSAAVDTLLAADLAFTRQPLARGLLRHLGRRKGPALLHAADGRRGARSRCRVARSSAAPKTTPPTVAPSRPRFSPSSMATGARICSSTNRVYWNRDAPSSKELDISVIFAAIHAGGGGPTHSARDPRMLATLGQLEALFDAEYAINRNRGAERGPAMGRYAGDVYYSGGAYYFSTLAAAEFCYRAAVHSPAAAALIARGDAFLQTVRAYTPPSGELSEQFDQHTGVQRSAQQLAWSYAAFITCAQARRQVSQHRA